MNCRWVQDRLLADMAGELKPQEASRVDAHLRHCSDCRELVGALAETEAAVEVALQLRCAAPIGFSQRVMKEVRSLPSPRLSFLSRPLFYRWKQRLLLVSGISLLLLTGYVVGYRHADGRRPARIMENSGSGSRAVYEGQEQAKNKENKELVRRKRRRPWRKQS